MQKINWILLLACVVGVLLTGFISGVGTAAGMNGWYETLRKPSFNPPDYLFGPVWTLLYILMGVALYLILQSPQSNYRTFAIGIFSFQLFLNFCWSFLFFYFHRPDIALIEIILLWLTILIMIFQFYNISPIASFLQIPYLLWVSFATVLNAALWYLNLQ